MIAYIVVCLAALMVSCLTLFSGFGLGSLLMPVFAVFFPIEVAVATTAVVHLLNNLFKLYLMGRHADLRVVFSFALPAAGAALAGAWLLLYLSELPVLYSYEIGGREFVITPVKVVISFLIVVFSLFELHPVLKSLKFDRRYLPLGGALSGFFGGVSGHQGALRAAFLAKLGLTAEAFVGTGVAAAVLVDVSRLLVYGILFFSKDWRLLQESGGVRLVLVATLFAFLGSFFGSRLVKKVTMEHIQKLVGWMLLLLAFSLFTGLI